MTAHTRKPHLAPRRDHVRTETRLAIEVCDLRRALAAARDALTRAEARNADLAARLATRPSQPRRQEPSA